jgi:Holliday junction resolvase RusA-like endonuclease
LSAHLSQSDWQKLIGKLDLSRIKMSSSVAEKLAEIDAAPQKPAPTKAVRTSNRIIGTIPGKPIGKPRMTQSDKWKRRPCVVAYWEWADKAREVMGELPPASDVDELHLTAYFEPPESWSKKRRVAAIGTKHRVKPDLDNVCKAAMDVLFKQDSAIADALVRKRWDWHPRLEIEIILTPSMN